MGLTMTVRKPMQNRNWQRFLTLKTGKIVSDQVSQSVDCAIVNISEMGAGLLVPKDWVAPKAFRLIVDPDGEARNCRLQWQSGSRIGVSFEQADSILSHFSTLVQSE